MVRQFIVRSDQKYPNETARVFSRAVQSNQRFPSKVPRSQLERQVLVGLAAAPRDIPRAVLEAKVSRVLKQIQGNNEQPEIHDKGKEHRSVEVLLQHRLQHNNYPQVSQFQVTAF